MNSVEDLRQTLEAHTHLAPDSAGILQHAQTGATRIRRRRRIARTTMATAALAIAVAGVPIVLHHGPSALTGSGVADHRRPGQFTVEVADGSGATLKELQSYGPMQSVAVSVPMTATAPGGATPTGGIKEAQATVYDPGAFDPTELRRGTRVTVSGHAAWLRSNYVPGDHVAAVEFTDIMLGWKEPAGAWVLVTPSLAARISGRTASDPEVIATLTTVAELLRIGPPRDTLTPYRLNWLPDGVGVDAVLNPSDDGPPRTTIGLSKNGILRHLIPQSGPIVGDFVMIDTTPTTAPLWRDTHKALSRSKLTVAGHPAQYQPAKDQGHTSELAIEIGDCGITIRVTGEVVTFAEQQRMVREMGVVDCAAPATWISVR